MKNSIKRFISLVLALELILSLCTVSVTAEEKKSYIYVGDSMSYDFEGSHKWGTGTPNIYAKQIATKYGYSLGTKAVNKMGLPEEPMSLGGLRTTDLYALISDYEGDAYTKEQYPSYITPETKKAFAETIELADLISIHLGYSNYSIVFLNSLISDGYDLHSSDLFTAEEVARVMPVAKKAAKALVSFLKSDTVKKAIGENGTAIRETAVALFGEDVVAGIEALANGSQKKLDSVVYLFASEIIHFDRSIERIRELNPDVDIYVLGLFNPTPFLGANVSLGELSYTVDLGKISSGVFGVFNNYMQYISPERNNYTFVPNSAHSQVYGELMQTDYHTAWEIAYDLINGDQTPNEVNQARADELTPGIMKLAAGYEIDLTGALLSYSEDALAEFKSMGEEEYILKCCETDENGELTATKFEQTLAFVSLMTTMKGVYVHPTQQAHDDMARRLISAIENNKVNTAYNVSVLSQIEKLLISAKKSSKRTVGSAWGRLFKK